MDDDLNLVQCPTCVKLKKDSRVYPGVRAINYLAPEKVCSIDFRCTNDHEWMTLEPLPKPGQPTKKGTKPEEPKFPF